MMKGLGGMLGRKATPAVTGRGQAGILLRDEVDGVVVASVLKGSPSDTAGVKQGDRLRKVADRSVTSSSEALDFAAKHAAGKTLALQVERSGKSIDLTINLVEGY
jgi:S1-C subfamily serine protease